MPRGSPGKKTSFRLPADLEAWVRRQAEQFHGGNVTAAIIALLSEYKPIRDDQRRQRERRGKSLD